MFSQTELDAAVEALQPRDPERGKLSSASKSLLLAALRMAPTVKRRPAAYHDLEARLAAAEGMNAVQLQAALMLLQGPQASAGQVGKAGGRTGIIFSKTDNRNAILELAISVMYPPLATNTTGRSNATAQMVNPAANAYASRGLMMDADDVTRKGEG